MPALTFALIDETGKVPTTDLTAFAAAQNEAIGRLAELWPEVAGSQVVPVGSEADAPAGSVMLVIAPNTTVANSLGYHDDENGAPVAIVEMEACQQYNQPWTIPASHEVFETLINPMLTRFSTVGPRSYPVEISDPATSDVMTIDGVPLANAVSPSWFDPNGAGPFDLLGKLSANISAGIPSGGWLEWSENGQWQNAWGADLSPDMIAYMRARHGRRWRLRGKVELPA